MSRPARQQSAMQAPQRTQQQASQRTQQQILPVDECKKSEQELKAYRKVVVWFMFQRHGNADGYISINTVTAANHSGLTREDLLLAMRNAKNDGFVRLVSTSDDIDEVYRFNGPAPTNEEKEYANARAKIIRQEMQQTAMQAEQQAAMQAEQQAEQQPTNAHNDDEIASDYSICSDDCSDDEDMQDIDDSVRSVCGALTDNSD